MRASLPALLFLAIAAIDETTRAAETEDVAPAQAPAPQPPNLFRLPQDLFTPPQPLPPQTPPALPDWSQRRPTQLQRRGGVAYCGHIRVIPANPNIDPKFIIPRRLPDAPVTPQRRPVAPPMQACEYEGGAPRVPIPAPAPVAPQ